MTTEIITKTVNKVKIINPVAGKGIYYKKVQDTLDPADTYVTKFHGDGEKYVRELCEKNPHVHITAYGGDGTMHEIINGIAKSGHADTVTFTGIASGSGNDYLRYMNGEFTEKYTEPRQSDLLLANGRYVCNVMNSGFDCEVVAECDNMKKIPFVAGSFAYILALIKVLIMKKTFHTKVKLIGVVGADGSEHDEEFEDDFLLMATAVGQYYGGGFKVAPLARADDGFVDVIMVKSITRRRFIALVPDFRAGTHIDADTGDVIKKFADVMIYRRCRAIEYEGAARTCFDGEVTETRTVSARTVPNVIRYAAP